MNRIDKLFGEKKNNILSIYFTAGYPALNDTLRIVRSLDTHGADMIEIGIPFSDPVADGPVIQASSQKAIEKGMTIEILFNQLEKLREITQIPVILMGYYNPVYRYGMDNFLKDCKRVGIDGLILPDLPLEIYQKDFKASFDQSDIKNVLLLTPQTPIDRIHQIDETSGGFIYMVSSYATTGVKGEFSEAQIDYFSRIKSMNLRNPLMVGFGISDARGFNTVCQYASGGIIGSAFIRALNENGKMDDKVKNFIQSIMD